VNSNAVVRLNDFEVFRPSEFYNEQYLNWYYDNTVRTLADIDRPYDPDTNPRISVTTSAPIARVWFKSRSRHQVDSMTYNPGARRFDHGQLNRWRELAVKPVPGDITPWSELLTFLVPNTAERKYFEQWLAYPLQHPGTKHKVAVILQSITQGLGKNLVVEPVQNIYGINATLIGEKNLHGDFNSWQKDRQFIIGDEIQGGKKPQDVIERVKLFITSPTIIVNEKFKPSYEIPNMANFLFISNNPEPFYLSDEDRRFWVPELTSSAPLSDAFYQKVHDWKESKEGIAALYDYLMHVDLTGFSPDAKAPMTNSKRVMIEVGRSDLDTWVRGLLDYTDRTLFRLEDLVKEYLLDNLDNPTQKATHRTMRVALVKAGFKQPCNGQQIRIDGGRQKARLWATPNGFKALEELDPAAVGKKYDEEPE